MGVVQAEKKVKNMIEPYEDFLRKRPLFKDLTEQSIELFLNNAVIKQFKKGKVLFLQGGEADYFYVIQSGWVKLFRETIGGDEAIVDMMNHGGVFGDAAIFDNDTIRTGRR